MERLRQEDCCKLEAKQEIVILCLKKREGEKEEEEEGRRGRIWENESRMRKAQQNGHLIPPGSSQDVP